MRFSIVTATYNRQATLARALDSVRIQTYPYRQHIVIDGGSSDGSVAVAQRYLSASDILVVEKDEGIYDALNKGVSAATGDIICFLHSDDFYPRSDVLESIAYIFDKEGCDVVYGNAAFFGKNDSSKITRFYKSPALSIENLAKGRMPAHPAVFCRTGVFREVGLFNTGYSVAGDYDWLCRLALADGFVSSFFDSTLVSMQSGGKSGFGILNTGRISIEIYKALRDNNIDTSFLKVLSRYFPKLLELRRG